MGLQNLRSTNGGTVDVCLRKWILLVLGLVCCVHMAHGAAIAKELKTETPMTEGYVRVHSVDEIVTGVDEKYILVWYDDRVDVGQESYGVAMGSFQETNKWFNAIEDGVKLSTDRLSAFVNLNAGNPLEFSIATTEQSNKYRLLIGSNIDENQYITCKECADYNLSLTNSHSGSNSDSELLYCDVDITFDDQYVPGSVVIKFIKASSSKVVNLFQYNTSTLCFSNFLGDTKSSPYLYRKAQVQEIETPKPFEWEPLTKISQLGNHSVLILTTDAYRGKYNFSTIKEDISLAPMTATGYDRTQTQSGITNVFDLTPFRIDDDGVMRNMESEALLQPMMFDVLKDGDGYTLSVINGDEGWVSPMSEGRTALLGQPVALDLQIADNKELTITYEDYVLTYNPWQYYSQSPRAWIAFYQIPCEPIYGWILKLDSPEMTKLPSGDVISDGDELSFTAPAGYHIYYMIHDPIYIENERRTHALTATHTDGWVDTGSKSYTHTFSSTDGAYQLSVKSVNTEFPAIQSEPLTMRIEPDGIVTSLTLPDFSDILDSPSKQDIEYFNLQGIPTSNPLPGHIYILRQGSSARKVRL